MTEWNTEDLAAADKRFVWHPFTNMPEWCAAEHEPVIIVEGHGATVRDSRGREYIDGNSSIWTNIHGHNHPKINRAISQQLARIAHSSFLGTSNPPAIELAREIVSLFPPDTLTRVFYSDDGSTAIEAAVRIATQFFRMRGEGRKTFIAFRHGYHGDTAGAAALGAAWMFAGVGEAWNFPVRIIHSLEELENLPAAVRQSTVAVVIEPLIQGAAGIRIWPDGTCAAVRKWCDRTGALMIADEVLTAFGRTGKMFALEHEGVTPDLMALGKGLSGGYLPLAMTLATEGIFAEFSGSVASGRALAYGHSYTGNALGCAAARASLAIFLEENVLENLQPKISHLAGRLRDIRQLPNVRDVRQCGFIAGIEMDTATSAREACQRARDHGLLTRNIRNVVVFMPPLCITIEQVDRAMSALIHAVPENAAPELANT